MAQKRMFSLQIVDSDAFLDMPQTSQLLYFHLSMRADDEGFVSSPKRVMRMTGASEDDYKVLVAKKFIIPFESGICVIKHWLIHNTIRMDRFGGTAYLQERAKLIIKDNKAYKLVDISPEIALATTRQPSGNRLEPQVKLSKDNISKDNNTDELRSSDEKPEKLKFEPVDLELSNYLYDLIKENTPTFKEPDLAKWAEHCRLMRERDKRTPEQIRFLIKWSQANDFWQANILSTNKLRQKFDQLVAQVKRDSKHKMPVGRGIA